MYCVPNVLCLHWPCSIVAFILVLLYWVPLSIIPFILLQFYFFIVPTGSVFHSFFYTVFHSFFYTVFHSFFYTMFHNLLKSHLKVNLLNFYSYFLFLFVLYCVLLSPCTTMTTQTEVEKVTVFEPFSRPSKLLQFCSWFIFLVYSSSI